MWAHKMEGMRLSGEYFPARIAIVATLTLATYTSLAASAKSTAFPTSDALGACAYTFAYVISAFPTFVCSLLRCSCLCYWWIIFAIA